MARKKWRTVSCADDGLRSHPSQQKAYAWISERPAGERFRVQIDEGYDWENWAVVTSVGNGTTSEE
jgi:hypothetical protein